MLNYEDNEKQTNYTVDKSCGMTYIDDLMEKVRKDTILADIVAVKMDQILNHKK